MKTIYKDLLFRKHFLISEPFENENFSGNEVDCFNVAMTLAGKFGIRIRKNIMNASLNMIRDAERNLGINVPEPFYRNFPYSVRSMTADQLYYDQLLHYTQTYGLGWWDDPGHSMMEAQEHIFVRRAFNEHNPPKDFKILSEREAIEVVKDYVKDILSINRPLMVSDCQIIMEAWKDFKPEEILPDNIPCKNTVIQLLYYFKNTIFCKYLKLSDTIKLLEHIQYYQYSSENVRKLNLRNQDRKLLTKVIETFEGLDNRCNFMECFEKRKIWCGLLHHIHYRANTSAMTGFIRDIREGKNFSIYHNFEGFMRRGEYGAAARELAQFKGKSDLVRHLNYILSRCESDKEVEEVLSWLI